jgi:exodeoxyribonuclease V beta subunit
MSPVFDVIRDPLPSGFLAIEASAGTGKTWTLSHLVVRLLLADPDLEPRKLLVVTFTNAATDELSERIRRVLDECRAAAAGRPGSTPAAEGLVAAAGGQACLPRIETLLSGLDELGVSTIHAWCKRVLESAAFDSGEPFTTDLAADDGELVAAAVRDAWRARLWSDARLAAVAVAQGWTVESDMDVWRRWNRHPGTRIEPQVAIEDALTGLDAAATALQAEAVEPALGVLQSWGWKKPYQTSGKDLLGAGLAALAGLAKGADPAGLVADIAPLAADTVVAKGVVKKHVAAAAANPLLLACQALRDGMDALRIAWLGWLCPAIRVQLEQAQARAALRTQDDLLRRVCAGVRSSPRLVETIRSRWSIALIDEFQDTDPVQWEIIRRCWADDGRFLVVVGDPKQAIYRFRGADLDAYLDAVQGAQRTRLDTNFRSDRRLVRAVLDLIGAGDEPFLDPRIDLPPVEGRNDPDRDELIDAEGAPMTVLIPPGEDDPPRREQAVASELVRLLSTARLRNPRGDRRLAPRDCAVLVRSGAQAAMMRDELLRHGVPAAIAASGDVLEGETAQELVAVLSAVARPRDAMGVRAALATRLWGLDAAAILGLGSDDAAWQRLCEDFERHLRTWQRHGLAACVEEVCAERASQARLAALPDGERRLTDLRHAVEVLHGESSAGGLRPAALLAWWARRQVDADVEVRRLRLDSDASAVRILTMHVAKGLEFPVVFCPYLGYRHDHPDEGFLVPGPDGHRLVLGGPGYAEAEAAQEHADDAEQLRLAYVALTRARLRCYVLWGRWDNQLAAPLRSALGWWLRPAGEDRDTWRAAADGGPERAQRLLDTIARLHELTETGDGIRIRAAVADDAAWTAPVQTPAGDALRRLPTEARLRLDHHRRITSFTGLLAGDGEERRDEPVATPRVQISEPTGPRALARGADVGDAWHGVLEEWDFTSDPSPAVRKRLQQLGIDRPGGRNRGVDDPVAVVATTLRQLAVLPLPGPDGSRLRLDQAAIRLAEWEFHLPVERIRPDRVLSLIRAHDGLPAAARRALPELRDAAPGGGLLRGFVDLLASDGERWWVIDWKTNHLGDALEDYREERLWQAMAGHGYVVQALLYVLALHRHLRHRLGDDYDYDRHVAGTAWIFLRGVDGGAGVCTWSPPRTLVEALDAELLP